MDKMCKEFAKHIKNTEEFRYMQKCKLDLEKNKSLKKQLDNYLSKKNNITSKYKLDEATRKVDSLNNDFRDFFSNPVVSNYMESTRKFNLMMTNVYKSIEKELIK